jgi:hypothetical protein
MLTGGSAGETYAADALNRDLVTQLLTHDQRRRLKFFKERMLVVAEAQEHFDYEERGGRKYPLMEEILEVDPDSGEEKIVERPKLLVPTIKPRSMSLADQESQRQFLEALREVGVPISMKTRLINVPIDLDEEVEKVQEEQVNQAVASEETRRATYLALKNKGLPIKQDLREDFEPRAQQVAGPEQQVTEEGILPNIGLDQPAPTVGLVPTDADIAESEEAPDDEEVANESAPPPRNRFAQRPPESDEMRADMPKKESRLAEGPFGNQKRRRLDPDRPLDEQR